MGNTDIEKAVRENPVIQEGTKLCRQLRTLADDSMHKLSQGSKDEVRALSYGMERRLTRNALVARFCADLEQKLKSNGTSVEDVFRSFLGEESQASRKLSRLYTLHEQAASHSKKRELQLEIKKLFDSAPELYEQRAKVEAVRIVRDMLSKPPMPEKADASIKQVQVDSQKCRDHVRALCSKYEKPQRTKPQNSGQKSNGNKTSARPAQAKPEGARRHAEQTHQKERSSPQLRQRDGATPKQQRSAGRTPSAAQRSAAVPAAKPKSKAAYWVGGAMTVVGAGLVVAGVIVAAPIAGAVCIIGGAAVAVGGLGVMAWRHFRK